MYRWMFFSKTSHLLTFYFINILLINYWLWKKYKSDPPLQLRRHGRIASIMELNAQFFKWMDTVLHGEECYQKKFTICCGIFWYISVTYFIVIIQYLRAVNGKSPWTVFTLYEPPWHISPLPYNSTIGEIVGLYDSNKIIKLLATRCIFQKLCFKMSWTFLFSYC